MDGVEQVQQLDDTHLHWIAEFGGSRHEWEAEITEQKPDERVAWRNTGGQGQRGRRDVPPPGRRQHARDGADGLRAEGIKEKIGDALGAPDRRVQGDLERFKELVESRGGENGGWRGEVKRPDEAA